MRYIFSVNNDDVNANVVIKLTDDCKNGRQDFSITGTFWEVGDVRVRRNAIAVGCCHDLIGKHFPEFQSFVKLHGRDFQGAPTYPIENGLYFAQPGKHHAEETGADIEKATVWMVEPEISGFLPSIRLVAVKGQSVVQTNVQVMSKRVTEDFRQNISKWREN